ncbi:SAM-dependent methyltransferase [Planosporangium sp. 12N6]|uniref:SAM-dependent methyltransferase n=1 Tax=Planosporangium spinosum TaxID=3402278 RepID=UPI003CE9DAEF
MERPTWVPEDVDVERPSVARVYDYYLGGSHNFAVDREFARKVLRAMPDATTVARENRAFLRRAVRHLCDLGIRQFIDLGSGIPTVGNVHEVAQGVDPEARVVYVDIDPVAYAHSQAILADNPQATVIRGDLRQPAEVLADPQVRAHIDFDRPVGLLLVAVLHFIPDEQRPADIVAGYASAIAPGSHLVLSHLSIEVADSSSDEAVNLYQRSSTPLISRTADELAAILGGLSLVEPGIVRPGQWHPEVSDEQDPTGIPGLVAVARRD